MEKILMNILGSMPMFKGVETIQFNGQLDHSMKIENSFWDGSLGKTETVENCFHWTLESGITEIHVDPQGQHGSNYAYTQRFDYEGEAVGDALIREGIAEGYVFVHHVYERAWAGQEHEYANFISIYKI